jgi:hypothetical protein
MKISYKLDEDEKELIEELSNITGVDYEIVGDLFPADSFIPLLKDLKYEIGRRDERIENYEENWKPKTPQEIFE